MDNTTPQEAQAPEVVDAQLVKQERALEPVNNELSVDEVLAQIKKIQNLMAQAMTTGVHYGTIPGCGDKPTLLKPGAETLCFLFKIKPRYTIEMRELGDGHREYEVTCDLYHTGTGNWVGQGVGNCSTMESKYRWRKAQRSCPHCGETTIIKGKKEYGGGWICWNKPERGSNGCGAKFQDGDPAIEAQEVGRVANPDIADVYNTVKKMGKKRAHIDATLTATAASDIFTQDLEDLAGKGESEEPATAVKNPQADSAPRSASQKKGRSSKNVQQVDECKHGINIAEFCGECSQEADRATTEGREAHGGDSNLFT